MVGLLRLGQAIRDCLVYILSNVLVSTKKRRGAHWISTMHSFVTGKKMRWFFFRLWSVLFKAIGDSKSHQRWRWPSSSNPIISCIEHNNYDIKMSRTEIIGCVVLPWHFEFYILKCKNLKCKNFFDWFSRWIRQF